MCTPKSADSEISRRLKQEITQAHTLQFLFSKRTNTHTSEPPDTKNDCRNLVLMANFLYIILLQLLTEDDIHWWPFPYYFFIISLRYTPLQPILISFAFFLLKAMVFDLVQYQNSVWCQCSLLRTSHSNYGPQYAENKSRASLCQQ